MVATPIDQVIRSNRKTVALIITADAKLVVRAPIHYPSEKIEALVRQKSDWITKKLALTRKRIAAKEKSINNEKKKYWYLGKQYEMNVMPVDSPTIRFDGKFIISRRVAAQTDRIFIRWYRTQARSLLEERTAMIAKKYGFTYKKIKITSARTRWGSCSTSGTISFPWRLVMAPIEIIDYVVVHELVHTVERNHQKGFWSKVAVIEPNYKDRIRWLKANGSKLQLGSN